VNTVADSVETAAEDAAAAPAAEGVTPPSAPDAPAAVTGAAAAASASRRSRREARLAATADATPNEQSTDAALPSTDGTDEAPRAETAADRAPAGQSRRAARAAAAAIAAATAADVPLEPTSRAADASSATDSSATDSSTTDPSTEDSSTTDSPTAVVTPLPPKTGAAPGIVAAASTVAAPRPHAQKLGRRAAESFSDAIERPAGGRRAIISVPTTAVPIIDGGEAPKGRAATGSAKAGATDDAEGAALADLAIPATVEVEIVVTQAIELPARVSPKDDAERAIEPDSATTSSTTLESASVQDLSTAVEPTTATTGHDVERSPQNAPTAPAPVAPLKPVSRRTLRAAALGSQTPGSPESADAASGGPVGAEAGSRSGTDAKPSGHGADEPSKTGRRGKRANIAKGGFSALALLFATGIAVATSMPASALHAASEGLGETVLADVAPSEPGQELTTSADVPTSTISRDTYSVRDTAALKAAGFRIADTFTNNPNGTIQWPFPIGVPISDYFGPRESPGGIGSTDHKGVDFTPGQGTPIQSIADGVVSTVEPFDNSGLGVHVIVDHVINGQLVQSVYGHMIVGSITVTEGQVIKVAQVVGQVGNTGASTGAHLHLEIRPDGVAVDPYAWLKANAN
jgi:murein DD-endopeptidase MepM/ murein hydrolase activator NlpD